MILTKHVRVGTSGRLGRITLDRPEAINALTQSMIEEIDFALDRLLVDPAVETVVLDGAGERGFCAGGDVVALRDSALVDGSAARRFWRSEYRLDARIASFPKPVVAVMDGIVMGGGVGLAGHATHRIATERLVWAMPEVRIGFAPDVGGSYLLSRLPGELGTCIALTARRLGADEAVAVGLADRIVHHDEVEEMLERLAVEPVAAVLADDRRGPMSDAVGIAGVERELIDEWFAGDDPAAIERRLEGAAAAARPLLDDLRAGSPASIAVTLAALRRATRLPGLEECLEAEFRTSSSFLEVEDFREGIRAVLVDKEGSPDWRPGSIEEVDGAEVDRIIAGPPDLEPLWDAEHERSAAWTST